MIVTLTGPNDFARRQELETLTAAFAKEHGEMAIERLDGEDASPDRLRESVESLPFLSARKLVILREPSRQKAFAEAIADLLGAVADSSDVIIVEPKLDKRLAYYKTLRKQTDFRDFDALDGPALARWAVSYAAGQGGSLKPADASFLIERTGPNQQLLKSELDKLVQCDPQVSRRTIELLTEPTPQSTIFELLDAALAGNARRTLELYREQRFQKVEPLAIVALLTWQLHICALIATAGGRSAEEVARAAKLSPFVVRKSQQIVRRRTVSQIKAMIAQLLAMDLRLKTTAIDADEALQHYLLEAVSP